MLTARNIAVASKVVAHCPGRLSKSLPTQLSAIQGVHIDHNSKRESREENNIILKLSLYGTYSPPNGLQQARRTSHIASPPSSFEMTRLPLGRSTLLLAQQINISIPPFPFLSLSSFLSFLSSPFTRTTTASEDRDHAIDSLLFAQVRLLYT